MAKDERDLLEVVRHELDLLEKGWYRRSSLSGGACGSTGSGERALSVSEQFALSGKVIAAHMSIGLNASGFPVVQEFLRIDSDSHKATGWYIYSYCTEWHFNGNQRSRTIQMTAARQWELRQPSF
jgi:hypothetical protein